jgi:hypothetical protein
MWGHPYKEDSKKNKYFVVMSEGVGSLVIETYIFEFFRDNCFGGQVDY